MGDSWNRTAQVGTAKGHCCHLEPGGVASASGPGLILPPNPQISRAGVSGGGTVHGDCCRHPQNLAWGGEHIFRQVRSTGLSDQLGTE